jgi:hypothetical protein
LERTIPEERARQPESTKKDERFSEKGVIVYMYSKREEEEQTEFVPICAEDVPPGDVFLRSRITHRLLAVIGLDPDAVPVLYLYDRQARRNCAVSWESLKRLFLPYERKTGGGLP